MVFLGNHGGEAMYALRYTVPLLVLSYRSLDLLWHRRLLESVAEADKSTIRDRLPSLKCQR